MSDQTYNVKYNIEVESTEATRQLGNFTAAVEALSKFKGDMSGAVENVQNALKAIDKALCTDPSGKGRKYNYKFNIDTKYGEAKLGRIVTALTTIENKSKGINLVVNPGKAFNSKAVQKNAAEIIRHSQEVFRNLSSTTYTTQTSLTRSLGKINSALSHLERSRELNIQTDVAKGRLEEILALLGQVRTAAAAAMPLGRTIVQRAAKEKRPSLRPRRKHSCCLRGCRSSCEPCFPVPFPFRTARSPPRRKAGRSRSGAYPQGCGEEPAATERGDCAGTAAPADFRRQHLEQPPEGCHQPSAILADPVAAGCAAFRLHA